MQAAPKQENGTIQQVTWVGLVINVGLSCVKGVIGVISGSQALVADALHSLSDLVTDIAVLVGVVFWTDPPDQDHPHGHGRIETMVTLFIGGMLIGTGLLLGLNAVSSLYDPQPVTHPFWVGLVALLSMVSKELLFQWTMRVSHRTGSSALYANAWHHRSDGLSSVPVLVSVIALLIEPSWTFLDPVGALIVAAFILRTAWDIFLPAIQELMDTGAPQSTQQELCALVRATEGVCSMHKLRTRYIGRNLQVDMHIQVEPALTVAQGHTIAHRVKDRLINNVPNVQDVLIHVEPYSAPERSA